MKALHCVLSPSVFLWSLERRTERAVCRPGFASVVLSMIPVGLMAAVWTQSVGRAIQRESQPLPSNSNTSTTPFPITLFMSFLFVILFRPSWNGSEGSIFSFSTGLPSTSCSVFWVFNGSVNYHKYHLSKKNNNKLHKQITVHQKLGIIIIEVQLFTHYYCRGSGVTEKPSVFRNCCVRQFAQKERLSFMKKFHSGSRSQMQPSK